MTITVVIPTNRYNCIKEIVEKSIVPYKGSLFRFEIHDSSLDIKIENMIQKLNKRRNYIVTYHRYSPNTSADDKAMSALENVESEYFWLMGDGNLIDFNKIERIFQKEIADYTVIDVESINRIGHMGQDRNYKCEQMYRCADVISYAKKYFSHLTYWGAPIIKTNYYKRVYNNGILRKYKESQIPWWIACSVFDLLANSVQKHEHIELGIIYTDNIKNNRAKKDHWWSKDERYYEYTFVKFNQGIKLLSSFYSEDIKKEIIRQFRKDALVSNYYLIHLRAINNLNLKMLKKYKQEINIIPGFYRKMYLYHLMPKILAKSLDYLKIKIKPFYFNIKRRMIK